MITNRNNFSKSLSSKIDIIERKIVHWVDFCSQFRYNGKCISVLLPAEKIHRSTRAGTTLRPGIAKCTGNDGPWRRYEWIYGTAGTGGAAGAPRLWPRSFAFSSSRYCCTVSTDSQFIQPIAYTIRRDFLLVHWPRHQIEAVTLWKFIAEEEIIAEPLVHEISLVKKKREDIFFFYFLRNQFNLIFEISSRLSRR